MVRLFFLVGISLFLISCNQVGFKNLDNAPALVDNEGSNPTPPPPPPPPEPTPTPTPPPPPPPEPEYIENTATVLPGQTVINTKTDILFVVDNTQSMAGFQNRMAQAFNGFISELSQKSVDWRIAITTPQIDNSVSRTGANGKLIRFKANINESTTKFAHNGPLFIDNNTANADALFQDLVQFTNQGEKFTYDGRGIHAGNLAFLNNDGNLFRPSSHHAVIVLADEDNYVSKKQFSSKLISWYKDNEVNAFSAFDVPDFSDACSILGGLGCSRLDKFPADKKDIQIHHNSLYPSSKFTFHSVVQTDTKGCNTGNNNQWTTAQGVGYMGLSDRSGGTKSNICQSDYQAALQSVSGSIIQKQKIDFQALSCAPYVGPVPGKADAKIEVLKNGQELSSANYSVQGNVITFTPAIEYPDSVVVNYICKQ